MFIPSVAKFRYDWLAERIERAYLASLAFDPLTPALARVTISGGNSGRRLQLLDLARKLVALALLLSPTVFLLL